MFSFKYLLFPFSWLYGIITQVRNKCYDHGIFKSTSCQTPIIAVGNLSVGGTGKTPMVEYLIQLLQNDFQLATLSRGYKRQSSGYILADKNATAELIGDEPFQYFSKFKKIKVAVSESRLIGINNLLKLTQPPQVILLDDAFQHRQVKAGLYILLSSFDKLYTDDYVLPMGRLRENKAGAKRAQIIVITKCPANLSEANQQIIIDKIKPLSHQRVFFSTITYDENVYGQSKVLSLKDLTQPKIIIAGIAKPEPFIHHVKNENDEIMLFPDHHHFSSKEISVIKQKSAGKIILTTEKDFVRLQAHFKDNLYFLPITTTFLNKSKDFNQLINNYVRTNTRDS